MNTLVIGIILTSICQVVLTEVKNAEDLLSFLDNAQDYTSNLPSMQKYRVDLKPLETTTTSENKARQIFLQDIQQAVQKAQAKEFVEGEDAWRDSIVGVWDWFVSGMQRIASGMANLASQIIMSI